MPVISLSATPSQINAAQGATFTASISRANRRSATSINFTMSGTALLGADYSLSNAQRFVIPAGATSGSVTLSPLASSGNAHAAVMTLQSGKTFRLDTARSASVTINPIALPTPTPTPVPTPAPSATPVSSPTPRPTPAQSVWIAIRTDGLAGSGTQSDPYDGSTREKFDAVMSNLQGLTNLGVNLGPGTFRTATMKSWVVRPGWVIAGSGMYDTVIQLSGSVAGFHSGVGCLSSDPNISTDTVVIRDLTCDSNWDELGPTADAGLGARTVTDAVISAGSPVITSASADFSPADYSRTIVGAGIPSGATIVSAQDAEHATISQPAVANASAVSLTIGGEKNVKTGAIALWGSNNLIQNVRSINTYGSAANLLEQFVILLGGPRDSDGTGNVIQSCRVELPRGNYGNPYALSGWSPHFITNSKVLASYAEGRNDGWMTGFTTGGVNLAFVKNCEVDGNTFVDCLGAVYQDTGTTDGFRVTNNTVIRGAMGVSFVSADPGPKQNIVIAGNNLQIQNRIKDGAAYGVYFSHTGASNVTIDNNTITMDCSAKGHPGFFGVRASPLDASVISNNTFILTGSFYFNNEVVGSGNTVSNNKMGDGSPVVGLTP